MRTMGIASTAVSACSRLIYVCQIRRLRLECTILWGIIVACGCRFFLFFFSPASFFFILFVVGTWVVCLFRSVCLSVVHKLRCARGLPAFPTPAP